MGRADRITGGVVMIVIGILIGCWGVLRVYVAELVWIDGGARQYHSAADNARTAAEVRRGQIVGWSIAGGGILIAGAGAYTACSRGDSSDQG